MDTGGDRTAENKSDQAKMSVRFRSDWETGVTIGDMWRRIRRRRRRRIIQLDQMMMLVFHTHHFHLHFLFQVPVRSSNGHGVHPSSKCLKTRSINDPNNNCYFAFKSEEDAKWWETLETTSSWRMKPGKIWVGTVGGGNERYWDGSLNCLDEDTPA